MHQKSRIGEKTLASPVSKGGKKKTVTRFSSHFRHAKKRTTHVYTSICSTSSAIVHSSSESVYKIPVYPSRLGALRQERRYKLASRRWLSFGLSVCLTHEHREAQYKKRPGPHDPHEDAVLVEVVLPREIAPAISEIGVDEFTQPRAPKYHREQPDLRVAVDRGERERGLE